MPVISTPSAGCSGVTWNGQSRVAALRWAWAIIFLRIFVNCCGTLAPRCRREKEISRMPALIEFAAGSPWVAAARLGGIPGEMKRFLRDILTPASAGEYGRAEWT